MSDYYRRAGGSALGEFGGGYRTSAGSGRTTTTRRHERHGSAPGYSVGSLRPSSSGESYGIAATLAPSAGQVHALRTRQVPDRVPTPMDFSQFRESGELSDIAIVVDGREFNLHKFPLYTRSDFFRALARSDSGKVVLDEFPGGAETFEMVANYCYNKRIDVNKDNIGRLRCAAEFLQMNSPGNLADCADRYLIDVLTTAKLGRELDVITGILLSCRPLGAIAEQANIIDRCVNSIVDCWLLSSRWSRRSPSERLVIESPSFQRLYKLPLAWYKQLFLTARDKSVRGSLLVKLAQGYIADKIRRQERQTEKEEEEEDKQEEGDEEDSGPGTPVDKQKPKQQATESKSDDKVEENDQGKSEDAEEQDKNSDAEDAKPKDSDKDEDVRDEENEDDADDTAEDEDDDGDNEENEEDEEEPEVDLAVAMDTLLLELPERASVAEAIDTKWAAVFLRVADELKCECRGMLLSLASRLLYRFNSEDIASLSPELLGEVVTEASRDPAKVDSDVVCAVVDGYLFELAKKDDLDVDVFKKMVGSVPKDNRANCDVLFKTLEKLFKSDKVKLDDAEKKTLLETVDFSLLSEAALQEAHDSQLVPDPYVTTAALALCAKLRAELDTARDVIRTQAAELDKFGLVGGAAYPRSSSSWLHGGGVESDYATMTSAPEEPEPAIYDVYEDDLDSLRYSPPGVDPILEKGLGGQYFGDPFHVDTAFPYCYHQLNRRSCQYDDPLFDRVSSYRREPTPYHRASTSFQSSSYDPRLFYW